MAHFAYINSDNIVQRITVVNNSDILDENGDESEAIGIAFMEGRGWNEAGYYWKKTSYNTRRGQHILGGTPYRKNAAQPGWLYNASDDSFNPPRPTDKDGESCASFTLNNSTADWDPPLARPADDLTNAILEYDAENNRHNITNGPLKGYLWDESLYQSDNTKGWVSP
jgi:hypothetical protein